MLRARKIDFTSATHPLQIATFYISINQRADKFIRMEK